MKFLPGVGAVMLLLFSQLAVAEVLHSAEDGFELKIGVSVPATPEQAYQKFVDIGSWWSPEHTWWGKAENLSLTPEAGGCFCETDGDKSVLHLTVVFVSPNREIRLSGGLGPLQQMGLNGVLTFKFIPVSDNETRIVQIYRVSGYDPNGLKGLAPVVDKVQTLQMQRLQDQFTTRF
jgi:uncharacterized protein YndB with AHSA1/START domain